MFSVLTNIYKKKTKGPILMELFTATRKFKLFLTTRDVRCVHHGWHDTYRCDIQVLATHTHTHTHTSTWGHRYSSLLQWSMALGQRGLVGGSFAYIARNARRTVTTDLLVWYSNTFSHYIHSHRLAAEMWTTMKNNLVGKNIFEMLLSVQVS